VLGDGDGFVGPGADAVVREVVGEGVEGVAEGGAEVFGLAGEAGFDVLEVLLVEGHRWLVLA
jgi:hypothetical protein